MSVRLPDIRKSRAVLIGSANFQSSELPDLPAVRNNINGLAQLLIDPHLGSFDPQNCVVMTNPAAVRNTYSDLRRHVAGAEDTLLLYYAGHGLKGARNELYLTLSDTDPDEPKTTGVPFELIRDLMLETPAVNKILILDCCFSGTAITSMTSPKNIAGQLTVTGAVTLASVPANTLALAPEGAQYTAFTGELIGLLYLGVPNGPELLTVGDLYPRLLTSMTSRGLPRPERQGTGTVEYLGLVRNRAHATGAPSAITASNLQRTSSPATKRPLAAGQQPTDPTGLEYFHALEARAAAQAAAIAAEIVEQAEAEAKQKREAADVETAEIRVSARRDADALRAAAERETKALRTATAHEVAELKATVEREFAKLRATAEREITQLRAKASREAEEKRTEASKMLADARHKRDEDLQSLALELAERRERALREETARHAAAVAALQKLVNEAEERARTAEERAKELEQRAETRRIESETAASELIEKAKTQLSAAEDESGRMVDEARHAAVTMTNAAHAEIAELRRRKDSITTYLRLARSLLDDVELHDDSADPEPDLGGPTRLPSEKDR